MAFTSTEAVGGAKTIEEQPSPEDWHYKFIRGLTSGINLAIPAFTLRDTECTKAENVRAHRGELIIDKGYADFGQVLRGFPQKDYELKKIDGTKTLLLITTATAYHWVAAESEWQFMSSGVSTTLDTAEASGQTVLGVASTTNLNVDDYVGIILNDGSQDQAIITVVSAGVSITVSPALTGTANSGNAVVKAVAFAGLLTEVVSLVTVPSADAVIFTNGVDTPQVYNGTTCINLATLPSGLTTCKFVGLFENYVLLINCLVSGAKKPQRVYNSDTGDHTNWATGNANNRDLFDTSGHITGYAELAEMRVIYKENTIIRMTYVGSTDKLFNFETAVEEDGCLNGNCVIGLQNENIVVGNRGLYRYQGGFAITPIGDEIYDKVFGIDGNLNPNRKDKVFLLYILEYRELQLYYPSGSDTTPSDMIRFNLNTEAWFSRTFGTPINGGGTFRQLSASTWSDLTSTWTEFLGQWDSQTLNASAPTIHLMGNDKQVYENNFSTATDDGAGIAFTVETKDFIIPNRDLRFDRFDAELKGGTVTVSYSVDNGTTWIILKAFTLSAVYTRVREHVQFKFRTIRFRFAGTGGGFGLTWFAFKYKRETV